MFVIRAGYTGRSRRSLVLGMFCGFKPVVKATIKSEGEGGGGGGGQESSQFVAKQEVA